MGGGLDDEDRVESREYREVEVGRRRVVSGFVERELGELVD